MDNIEKLKALTGQQGVANEEKHTKTDWVSQASNIYKGRDSNYSDYVEMIKTSYVKTSTAVKSSQGVPSRYQSGKNHVDTTTSFGFSLKQGQLAPEGVRFMSWKTATNYPFMFIGIGNRQKVAEVFFDKGQVYDHTFDLFYLYPEESALSQPIILIPSKQFESLLNTINLKLKTSLTIPKGSAGDAFYIGFWPDGNMQPRYLGYSSSKDDFDALKVSMPPYWLKMDSDPKSSQAPDKSAEEEFKSKVALLTSNDKNRKKGAAKKIKKAEDKAERFGSWGKVLKRVQCYIGIRDDRNFKEAIEKQQEAFGFQWMDVEAALNELRRDARAKYGPETFFHSATSMKFKPKDSVIFIAIDVEAYEFNHKLITEIGIATLDALDIVNEAAGPGGKLWMEKIRARHFRIQEHIHLVNQVHVTSCAGSFEFGQSEFISIKEAPATIASCFRHPFSGPDTPEDPQMPKRNIVLVGHAVHGDVDFFKDLGYDLSNLSNLIDAVDTGDLWKYLKKEYNPAKLAIILSELDIVGWNLHNAGNDAVYTLQAMMGLAIKPIDKKGKTHAQELNLNHRSIANPSDDDGIDDKPSVSRKFNKHFAAYQESFTTGHDVGKKAAASRKVDNAPATSQDLNSDDEYLTPYPERFSPIVLSKEVPSEAGSPYEATIPIGYDPGWKGDNVVRKPGVSALPLSAPVYPPVSLKVPESGIVGIHGSARNKTGSTANWFSDEVVGRTEMPSQASRPSTSESIQSRNWNNNAWLSNTARPSHEPFGASRQPTSGDFQSRNWGTGTFLQGDDVFGPWAEPDIRAQQKKNRDRR